MDFDVLVTFDCTYGEWNVEGDSLRIFVEKGLVLPYCKLVNESNGVSFVRCEKSESSRVEDMFPVHYIYDAARQVEYEEWESVGGLLRARSKGGEWVQYESKSESLYAMHEFVGGCWFVFLGVSFSENTVFEYAKDRKSPSGLKVVQELSSVSFLKESSKKYLLEGVLNAPPGPGWMSWGICANSFYMELSGG
ncbi:hypothetical protein HX886_34525 [Pseudomonas gingeri]|uniref:Uncharacterized protein n=1 Tax=Pseudomonas gingeri TaxID=117681 RepID=A0A7Y7YK53_9PSED|nr:hypothetical protein [Pseudomonas gingeri]NWC37306.1 hypothetical protein [Pseudomonas gingeri]NWD52916.1 hypothetical protein [Pseudomonas gingeri]